MPPELKSKLESVLFSSSQPISFKRLAHLLETNEEMVEQISKELQEEYKAQNRGIQLVENGKKIEMVTHSENTTLVQNFLKEDLTGELTPASLETLTIVAYRGPITKMELEQIRGVNCGLILRNLMMKGLIEEERDESKMAMYYRPSIDFMRYLGIGKIEELPDYQKLHNHEDLAKLLEQQ